ncbi:MAG: universal stress protein [Nitrococcus sp.]|nr:universal stress protein [Nitrococcus sp.]
MLEPKILFATDFEGNLRHGLRLATDLSLRYSATLLVLHVIPFPATDGEALLHRVLDMSMQHPDLLLAGLAPTDPAVAYRHILETGEPKDQILEVAERERVDRIVLENRPRSLFRRALRPSVVDYLAARAPCPVVIYHAPRPSMGLFYDTSARTASSVRRVAGGSADHTRRAS